MMTVSFLSSAAQEEFLRDIGRSQLCISYQPLSDELDPHKITLLNAQPMETIYTPRDKQQDPGSFARYSLLPHVTQQAFLLIPGQRFDWSGTRHGRGAGWYDRLLASLPQNWIRVGVTRREQVSNQSLKRKPWDEPMDWLIYLEQGDWQVKRMPARRLSQETQSYDSQ